MKKLFALVLKNCLRLAAASGLLEQFLQKAFKECLFESWFHSDAGSGNFHYPQRSLIYPAGLQKGCLCKTLSRTPSQGYPQ